MRLVSCHLGFPFPRAARTRTTPTPGLPPVAAATASLRLVDYKLVRRSPLSDVRWPVDDVRPERPYCQETPLTPKSASKKGGKCFQNTKHDPESNATSQFFSPDPRNAGPGTCAGAWSAAHARRGGMCSFCLQWTNTRHNHLTCDL
jgi:hypothetical protein